MTEKENVFIAGAVEGALDQAVLERLIRDAGASFGTIYIKRGKGNILRQLNSYNNAANNHPWVVLVDLDSDASCAPDFVVRYLPQPSQWMCFRIAVREIESWLLADRERLSKFLGIRKEKMPSKVEDLPSPKEELIKLAKKSKSRRIQEDIVPDPESGRLVGPAYSSRLIEFVIDTTDGWRPRIAATQADSLARGMKCINELIKRWSLRKK